MVGACNRSTLDLPSWLQQKDSVKICGVYFGNNMVKINEEAKTAEVFLKIEEVSKAIGRGGNNIKLASLLTGYEIDVIREGVAEEEDDVELREFSDEIEAWVIEEFEKIGLDTARSVLNQEVADLVRRTDLEEETIIDVMNVLKEELEG